MTTNYQTLKEAGYTYHKYISEIKMHVLINNYTNKKNYSFQISGMLDGQ